MQKVELLAPAGNFECLVAAVQSGADAVYFAGKSFGARSFADNFDNEKLCRAVDYCHIRGVKAYVTVNTLVFDSELSELTEYLYFLNNIGVDAIIVQDMGVLKLARQIVPNLSVHASTQMTIHNKEGVNFLKELGVKRVVLSRELSFDEIKEISESCDLEIEVFAHGALCMCYSGQCLLSSIIGGRSGNRGKCAQPCRLPYSINRKSGKAFFMSLKDLSSINHLEKFNECKVTSLKIEGRMKGAAYVAAVVGIYRKYIDNPQKVTAEDIEILEGIFNRGGFTDGYLLNKKGSEMFAPNKPDNPYLKGTAELEKRLLSSLKDENRKRRIKGRIEITHDKPPVMLLSADGITAKYTHDKTAEKAANSAIDAPSVISRLQKTGGTPFEFEELTAEVEDGLFFSVGELNKIRREALNLLEDRIKDFFKRKNFCRVNEDDGEIITDSKSGYVCEITTDEQLKAVFSLPFEKLYIPIGVIERNLKLADSLKDKIIIVLPAALRNKEYSFYCKKAEDLLKSGYHGILVQNVSLIVRFSEYNIYGGFRLNIANSKALSFFKDFNLKAAELLPELTLRQIKAIKKTVPAITMVYGRLPLMLCENCIIKNDKNCPCEGSNTITDRMGMVFPVIKDGDICRSVVLNCKKTFMAQDMRKIKDTGVSFFRLYFTDETFDECKRVCDAFLLGKDYCPDDFTKGHFYKGLK